VHVVTTDVLTGQAVLLSDGDAVAALLASCAIPGVFPSVPRDGRLLCDGALADESAVFQAAALGADRIYILTAGTACALDRPPRHPAAAALHAVTLLLQQRAILETKALAGTVDLRVIPGLCPLKVSAADFSHADDLISRARDASTEWLDSGSDTLPAPERFLSLHSHDHVATKPSRLSSRA
ncbi:MAG: patatin-like phospholipase family protein, partial [Pseudonocardia sp.]